MQRNGWPMPMLLLQTPFAMLQTPPRSNGAFLFYFIYYMIIFIYLFLTADRRGQIVTEPWLQSKYINNHIMAITRICWQGASNTSRVQHKDPRQTPSFSLHPTRHIILRLRRQGQNSCTLLNLNWDPLRALCDRSAQPRLEGQHYYTSSQGLAATCGNTVVTGGEKHSVSLSFDPGLDNLRRSEQPGSLES